MYIRLTKIIFLCLVGLILFHPIYFSTFENLDIPFFDNRELAMLPLLTHPKEILWASKQVDSYIADHLPLRNRTISAFYWFRQEIFHEEVLPLVIIGKNNWLYYTGEDAINLFQRVMPFSQAELLEITQNLERTRDWLLMRDILMVVVIAPEKSTIYPEYMPDYVPVIGKRSQFDQLLDYLSDNSTIKVLDLRPVFFEMKKVNQIYYASDTHWNDVGCHLAYETIMHEIAKKITILHPFQLEEFEISTDQIHGDLMRFIGQADKSEIDPYNLTPKMPVNAHLLSGDNYYSSEMSVNNPELPRLLMLQDSFGVCLVPLIAEHFSYSLFQWVWAPTTDIVDRELIEQTNPDVVIIEMTERYLGPRLLPVSIPEIVNIP